MVVIFGGNWYMTTVLCAIADGNKYKGGIYMVFEYMDHDLTGLADRPGMRFSVPQIKVLLEVEMKESLYF